MSEPSSVDAPSIPGFPPGVDPESYRREEVQRLLEQAAYLSIFSVPDASSPNVPVRLLPGLDITTIAVRVHETLHRFSIDVESAGAGLTARNRIGEPMASVEIRWTPMPDDFEAAPGRVPPPTLLNPFRSQRFCMLDGHLQFADAAASSLTAFGTGRTFPAESGGRPRLDIGAVIDVLSGQGKLAGLCGTICVNGTIEPPDGLALNLMLRFIDPRGVLAAPAAPVGGPPATAAAESVFLAFLGEVDPRQPVVLRRAPDGSVLGSQVHELLRRVSLDSSLDAATGLCGSLVPGPVVGRVDATLHFDPLTALEVSPIRTTDGVFTFFDEGGAELGSLRSDMVEGRAFKTPLAGAPAPIFRFGGFGPILGGCGLFAGASGMMSMNSAVSVFPRTLSNLYVLRLADPEGRLRNASAGGA